MTEQERADVRMAFRPLVDGLAGRPGVVTYEEWAAAVDRAFPPVPTDGTERSIIKGQAPPERSERATSNPNIRTP